MKPTETIKRFVVMLIGLIINALGLAVFVHLDLGVSPISTLPYALSQAFPIFTLGTYSILQHIVFFILIVLLLRRDFRPFQLLLLPCSFVFGYFVDFWNLFLNWLTLDSYFLRLLLLVLGCIVVSIGFSMVYTSGVALEANTALVNALVLRTGKSYGMLKTISDLTIIVLAAIVSLIFLHTIVGIREGTVISALLIGPIAGIVNKPMAKLERFFISK